MLYNYSNDDTRMSNASMMTYATNLQAGHEQTDEDRYATLAIRIFGGLTFLLLLVFRFRGPVSTGKTDSSSLL